MSCTVHIRYSSWVDELSDRYPCFHFLDHYQVPMTEHNRWHQDGAARYNLTVMFIGKTGYGKSTTLNAIVGERQFETSDVDVCTRELQCAEYGIDQKQRTYLVLCDFPGIGESERADEEYMGLYREMMQWSHCVVYLLRADQRDYALDEELFRQMFPTALEKSRVVLALNFADKMEPVNRYGTHLTTEQTLNLEKKRMAVARQFDMRPQDVLYYSATDGVNMGQLVERIGSKLKIADDALGSSGTELQDIGDMVSDIPIIGQIEEPIISGVGSVIEGIGDIFGGGCFITTATCRSRGKTDDCYELTSFRHFRDEWLSKQEGGQEQIAEYYRVAPNIVRNIDASGDSAAVYDSILRDYLAPCLADIESGRYEECRKRYTQMVHDLEREYLK